MMNKTTLIYISDVSPLADGRIYSAAYNNVSVERRKKTDAFRFEKDKRLSLGAELLLKKALADYGVSPRDMRFEYGENGKPYLAGEKDVFFNFSHSGTYVMCAVSDGQIGCDTEQITGYKDSLARHIFSAAEYADISSKVSEEEKSAAFFRYWTLRESYMKYTGLGLALPLSDFEITTDGETGVLKNGEKQNVFFGEFSSIPGYACAVCAETPVKNITLTNITVEKYLIP